MGGQVMRGRNWRKAKRGYVLFFWGGWVVDEGDDDDGC